MIAAIAGGDPRTAHAFMEILVQALHRSLRVEPGAMPANARGIGSGDDRRAGGLPPHRVARRGLVPAPEGRQGFTATAVDAG